MIDFLKYRWLYVLISGTVLILGFYSIFKWGFKYSIEFTGGTNLEYQLKKDFKLSDIKKVFKKEKVEVVEIKKNNKTLTVKAKSIDDKKETKLRKTIEKDLKTKVNSLRFETVGPILGKETMRKTLIGAILAIVGILIYITYAFKSFNFALAAVLAMLHDLLILLGTFSLLSHFAGAEVDTLFVTAVLTTMSFSVHDTIVIFDKVREYRHNMERNIDDNANKALTETMVRSVNNSMTIIFMLLSLVLLGGSTIRFFAIALLIGTISGTYSSPFVATPIAVFLESREKK